MDYFVIFFILTIFSFIQSIFGVGLLLFGTPSLLLIGYEYHEILNILLPASITISFLQVIKSKENINKSKKVFIYYCLPILVLFTFIVLIYKNLINFKLIISIILSIDFLRLRYIIFAVMISIFGYSIAYNNVIDFSKRVNSAKGLWIDEDFSINNTNNSSFVLYNNLHIAKKNMSIYPLFGTGLGSHETAFHKHTLTKTLIQYDFEFNVKVCKFETKQTHQVPQSAGIRNRILTF